jgi:hypothetical protein
MAVAKTFCTVGLALGKKKKKEHVLNKSKLDDISE